MSHNKLSFTCADCGGMDLRLIGFSEWRVSVSFETEFCEASCGHAAWEMDWGEPLDGPCALVKCRGCGMEVDVLCRNDESGEAVRLTSEVVYGLLRNATESYGLGEAFKGVTEVKWREFSKRLFLAHPNLGESVG